MPHIFTFASSKGGAGKTTLTLVTAGELSHSEKSVTIIDADANTPIEEWAKAGNHPDNIITVVDTDAEGRELAGLINDADTDFVLIDLEGTANQRTLVALAKSDLVIIPFSHTANDQREAVKTIKLVKKIEESTGRTIPFVLVQPRVSVFGRNKKRDADVQTLKDAGLPVLNVVLNERDPFVAINKYGCTIHQLDKSEATGIPKAKDNAKEFFDAMIEFYMEARNAE